MIRRIAKSIVILLVSVFALAGCSMGGSSNELEITQVVYVRTGGDVDKTEKFIIKPDLTMERTTFSPGLSFSNIQELESILADNPSGDVEYFTISDTAWLSIVNLTKRNNFMTLPEEIETSKEVFDGSYYYIRVDTADVSHASGGYEAGVGMEPNNRRFGGVLEYINNAIAGSEAEGS